MTEQPVILFLIGLSLLSYVPPHFNIATIPEIYRREALLYISSIDTVTRHGGIC